MNYLKLFEQQLTKIIGQEVSELIDPTLMEDKIEDVGREFQHIEDLVYIDGPAGAKRAIDRLAMIAKDSSREEIKWDGSPAIIFGRDEQGRFHLGDKYHTEFNASPEEVKRSYIGRSKDEISQNRMIFVNSMAELHGIYDAATPKDFRGFLEGALLYKTRPEINDKGEYYFKPNTVTYYVDQNSPLGQRIAQSTSASAITAYFDQLPGLGGQRRTENLTQIIKGVGSKDVIILPPKYSIVQAQIPASAINKLYSFLTSNASAIEAFITPSPEWIASFPTKKSKSQSDADSSPETGVESSPAPESEQPVQSSLLTATNKWKASIYKYVNSQVDQPGGLDNLGSNMVQWAETDPIFTKGRRQIAIDMIKNGGAGLSATFKLVRGIMNVKDVIVHQMEELTLKDIHIRAELPGGAAAGEGFVSDPGGGSQPLKLVNRRGFTAANRAQGRVGLAKKSEVKTDPKLAKSAKAALKESVKRTGNSDSAVVGWGRGMGHLGHMYLASAVITTAAEQGADPYFFLSKTVGADDPLLPKEKLSIYYTVFPNYKNIFRIATNDMPDMSKILHQLSESGYKNVTVIVGSDQKPGFQYLVRYNGKANEQGEVGYDFDNIKVISRQETSDKYAEFAGPRATDMRKVLTKPDNTYKEKFEKWKSSMPNKSSDLPNQLPNGLDDGEVEHYMQLAAQRLGFPVEKGLGEADNPQFGGAGMGSPSAIPGTPTSLQQQPTEDDIRRYHKEMATMQRFLDHRK